MHRLLQLKVISTAELTIKKKKVSNNLFVIIRTDCNSIWTSTKLETGHDCKHYENTLEMDLPVHVGFMSVEVYYSQGKDNYDNSKFIGATRIPVLDFLSSTLPENYARYLSYRLRDADGVRNGVVNFSIKVSSSGCVPKAVTSSMTPGIVSGVPVNWYAKLCV